MDIVRLLATGATNQQIAQDLFISVNTVKVHLRNIYAKLDVASRTEATMVAVREGWLDVPGLGGQEEEPEAEGAEVPSPPAGPRPQAPPPISLGKRVSLVVATLLALAMAFLPQILQGGSNDGTADPIGGVFPTAASNGSADRWHTRAQMPTPRTDLAIVAHEGLVYAIGGVSNAGVTAKLEIYDPDNDAWQTGSSKPTPVGFVSGGAIGNKIYVPGGIMPGGNGSGAVQPQDVLEIYDPVRDAWETGAPLPEPLGAYALAVLGDQLYLFGGAGTGGYVASAYRYDPAGDAWETLSPMGQARGLLAAAAVDDRIYVVGGYDDEQEFNTCEVYDPATDTWSTCPPMALGRGGLALVAVRQKLYAIGGGMTGYLAFNEIYEPRTETWSRFATPVTDEWRGLGAALVGSYIYSIGGWSGGNLSVNEAYQALFVVFAP